MTAPPSKQQQEDSCPRMAMQSTPMIDTRRAALNISGLTSRESDNPS
jgi:hypothetical protein